jgi:uroporphyrinogen-III synthase
VRKGPVILVIRSDDEFSSLLRDAGFEVVNLELIRTRPVDDLSDLRTKLATLSEYDGLFFTSPVAAEIFVSERDRKNGFHGGVYALGRRAGNVLEAAGLNVKTGDAANTAEELLDAWDGPEFTGRKFLFVRGEKSIRTIPERLSGRATVDEVAVYTTESVDVNEPVLTNLKDRLANGEVNWVCFFSPSGVERFSEIFGEVANSTFAATIGTTTADAARQSGFNVRYISPKSSAEDFARGLTEHIKSSE